MHWNRQALKSGLLSTKLKNVDVGDLPATGIGLSQKQLVVARDGNGRTESGEVKMMME